MAAADAGAKIFLVPPANCGSAQHADVTKDQIRLVKAPTMHSAVASLRDLRPGPPRPAAGVPVSGPTRPAAVDADPVLRAAVREIEPHAAEAGWDQPARLYALVPTSDLLAREPALAAAMGLDGRRPPAR